ncbi:hypothetical protein VSH64_30805 [Amycolatopsis rhabdoformis]|uniref:PpiC domain-containing protein n=1 Tax=Amycolatopsis rhabdoformis TaxID=1448059 RepID=A0ABZ1I0B9_9PSEU|nr:hypothetical protein [Amycolatopsis rhabdoformis]WSE27243.1 hypothetical protein VSH64_30805 [Amycolatopsis rhabdoformis]
MGRPGVGKRTSALAGVVAGGLLLAGCGAGPSQVTTAAVIDGQVTTIDQVQGLIDKSLSEQPYAKQLAAQHKLDLVGREIVRQQLLHSVVQKAAAQEHITADPATISAALAQGDPLAGEMPENLAQDQPAAVTQLVQRARDHREALTDLYLEQQLAAKYLPTLAVNFDYTSIGAPTSDSETPAIDPATARSQAIQKAQEYAASPGAIQAEVQNGAQGNVGQQAPALSSPEDAATVLFGVPANTAIAFQPNPTSAPTWWVTAVVKQRATDKPVATDQVQQPTPDQIGAIGVRLLQPYVSQVDFKINPRYGVWDPVGMDLAANANSLQGIVLPVRGSAPAQQ